MKAYCPLINNDLCEYGGNKRYNYGFISGMSSFCRLSKKWVHDLKSCPKTIKINENKKCIACNGYGFGFTGNLEKHTCDVCKGDGFIYA